MCEDLSESLNITEKIKCLMQTNEQDCSQHMPWSGGCNFANKGKSYMKLD